MARKADSALVRLHLDGQITLRRLNDALDHWADLLREVSTDVAGTVGRDAFLFIVEEAKLGSFDLAVRPQSARRDVPPVIGRRIAKTVTAGLQALERKPKRPKHFNDAALTSVRELGRLVSAQLPVVTIGNGSKPIPLSSRLLANVEAVLAPDVSSIGTIEGKLEGLIVHGKKRFLVYDPLTGRQVTCYFADEIPYDDVLRAFGQRVAVTGRIRSNRSGERVDINAKRLFLMPRDQDLPTPEDVLGLLKTAT